MGNRQTYSGHPLSPGLPALCLGGTQGIPPMDAVERLNRFKEESKIRERKQELYSGKGKHCRSTAVRSVEGGNYHSLMFWMVDKLNEQHL